ncbi:kelch repeat-containing protein 2, partial [Striga asiatica]
MFIRIEFCNLPVREASGTLNISIRESFPNDTGSPPVRMKGEKHIHTFKVVPSQIQLFEHAQTSNFTRYFPIEMLSTLSYIWWYGALELIERESKSSQVWEIVTHITWEPTCKKVHHNANFSYGGQIEDTIWDCAQKNSCRFPQGFRPRTCCCRDSASLVEVRTPTHDGTSPVNELTPASINLRKHKRDSSRGTHSPIHLCGSSPPPLQRGASRRLTSTIVGRCCHSACRRFEDLLAVGLSSFVLGCRLECGGVVEVNDWARRGRLRLGTG